MRPSARQPALPPAPRGLKIGLLGGSFNPPHHGHLLISRTALARLKLDAVWWIVTPGNPLKAGSAPAPLALRLDSARSLSRHPRIHVTGFEAAAGLAYTCQTLRYLRRRCPGARFIWLMGADNLAQFHRWRNWRGIASLMPFAVIDRPGSTLRALQSRAALALAGSRVCEHAAPALALRTAPAWVFMHGRRSFLSSTALRAAAAAKLRKKRC